jgi:hypothetical protein
MVICLTGEFLKVLLHEKSRKIALFFADLTQPCFVFKMGSRTLGAMIKNEYIDIRFDSLPFSLLIG